MPRVYLAIDLGAESGRVVAGVWDGKTIRLEELHRFPNGPVYLGDTLRWDVVRLWAEIQNGLAVAGKKYGQSIVSVGADTWGVDYVLLTGCNEMLGQPYAYRDARTNGMMEKAFKKVPRSEIFAQTGLQFMQFNTLFQLLAHQQAAPGLLEAADALLLMPDFIHWALCGSRVVEFTNGTTTQCMNPLTRNWATGLLRKFGLPARIFPKVVPPGARLGALRPGVADRTGLRKVNVVAPPTHDTASAVAGVPTANTGKANWAYISSGTWSLMGAEVKQASLSARTQELNLTNEGGLDGTYRLLKNIMGLWLVQECRRYWQKQGHDHGYAELTAMAERAEAFGPLIDPAHPPFLKPGEMVQKIDQFCAKTKQRTPTTPGEYVRTCLESLALAYRRTMEGLQDILGKKIGIIHIVGGGSQNELLNQMTADACARPVIAGPVEATAIGNILVQAMAAGRVKSLAQARAIVRENFNVQRYEPRNTAKWDAAYQRYMGIVDRE